MAESAGFRVLSWNINGLKAKLEEEERKTALLEIFDQYDIVLLQETKIGKMKDDKDDDKDWKIITEALSEKYGLVNLEDEEKKKKKEEEETGSATMYMTYFSSRTKGVAILVNKPHTLLKVFSEGGEYAWVHVEIDGQKYTFVSVYYHPDGPNLMGNLVLKIIYSFLTEGSDAFKCRLVIGGDFNTTLNPELDATTNISDHAARRKTLKAFLSIVKLSDVWRERNGDKTEYTHIYKKTKTNKKTQTKKTTTTKSRLDYVFMLENDVKYAINCDIINDKDPSNKDLYDQVKIVLSDHSPVSLTLNYRDREQPREE